MKRLLMLIPLIFLCGLGCQQGQKVASEDVQMDAQTIKDHVAELQTATDSVDPIIGKWTLNIAESTFSGEIPKEFTESYNKIDGNQIEFSGQWINADSSSDSDKFTFPAQGGVNKFLNPVDEGRLEIETLIAPGEWHMTGMQDGIQTITRHKVISADGKIMRQTIRNTDSQGNISEKIYVFDKQ